jgi:hypothetical protein
MRHERSGRAHRLHFNGHVFGCIANNDAEFTSLAPIDGNFGDHFRDVQIQTIGLGTVHNTKSTAFFGYALFVDDLRNIIHASVPLSRRHRGADFQLNMILFCPFGRDFISMFDGGQVLREKHFLFGKLFLDGFIQRRGAA